MPLEVMKGWQLDEAQGSSIQEIAYSSDMNEGFFVIGTENNQLLTVNIDTKDKNNDEIKKE